MIKTIFATKKSMIQAWDAQGRRLAITKLVVEPNYVVGEKIAQIKTNKKVATSVVDQRIIEIGYGKKKLKNNTKPLRTRFAQAGLKTGLKQIVGVRENAADGELLTVGQALDAASILTVGSIIKAQGTSKGRGFAGAVKRHGFHGGPKTHGQSDRLRATGSIGNRTTPGRVWLGKKMPGHFGVDTKTIEGLVIAHFDAQTGELWLTGAVPGSFNSVIRITLTGKNKKNFALDKQASGLKEAVTVETEVSVPVETVETVEASVAPVETPVVEEEQEKVEKA